MKPDAADAQRRSATALSALHFGAGWTTIAADPDPTAKASAKTQGAGKREAIVIDFIRARGAAGRPLASLFRRGLLILAAGASLAGCLGGDDADSAPGAQNTQSSTTGTISGRVYSGASGIAGASVVAGTASTTTDASGNFSLTGIAPTALAVVSVSATGYAAAYTNVEVKAGVTNNVNVEALAIGVLSTGNNAAAPVTVSLPSGPGQAVFAANSLVRSGGVPPTGTYDAALTAIAPASNVQYLPGEYRAVSLGGPTVYFESYGGLSVVVSENAGGALDLAGGQNATIRIPVSTRSSAIPASAALYSFNPSSGLWIEEGTAALGGTAPDLYYEATVTHLGIWSVGAQISTILVSGCAREADGTTPVANARIATDGINYSGASAVLSDASGNFQVAIKAGASAALSGSTAASTTNTVTAGPSATDYSLSSCLVFPAASTASASIKLTWGAGPNDVDSHLFTPDGSHVYYSAQGSLTSVPFASLDVDDTSSFGPEVITMPKLRVGTYTYAVHNYSGTFAPGMTASPVRVEFNRSGVVSAYVPGAGEGANTWWTVFQFTVASNCTITVQTVNTWGTSAPAATTSGSATYCTGGTLNPLLNPTLLENAS